MKTVIVSEYCDLAYKLDTRIRMTIAGMCRLVTWQIRDTVTKELEHIELDKHRYGLCSCRR